MIFVQPEHGARHQEAAHFGAAIVKDERLPVGMEALAKVGVLEQVGAIEEGEAVAVGREVRRDPVENHGDVVLVQVVHEIHEILRRAVARRGREVASRLISPGTVERVLHDGQQFDVGESQLIYVVGEAGRDLAIGERTVVLFGDAHPGAEVNLVDGHGRVQRVYGRSFFQKGRVVPGVVEIPDHGSGARRFLREKSQRIGLFNLVTELGGADVELVKCALLDAGDKAFPDSRRTASLEWMGLRAPSIEVSNHRHITGVGGPDAEDGALGPIGFHRMSAHLLVNAIVAAFVEQIKIFRRQQGNVVAYRRYFLSCRCHGFSSGLVYSIPKWRDGLCGGGAEPVLSGAEGPRQDGAEPRHHTNSTSHAFLSVRRASPAPSLPSRFAAHAPAPAHPPARLP